MPDDGAHNDDGSRSLLDGLVPTVDVDGAWAQTSGRFRRDRRRQAMARGAGALTAGALVVTFGAVALRDGGAGTQQLVVQAPPGSSVESSTPPGVPDRVAVGCAERVGSLSTPIVTAQAGGVVIDTEGDGIISFARVDGAPFPSPDYSPLQAPTIPGKALGMSYSSPSGTMTSPRLAPGAYDVTCGTATSSAGGAPIGTLEVVDPDEHFHAGGDAPAPCPDATFEKYYVASTAIDSTLAWRFGSDPVEIFGYPEGELRGYAVRNAAGIVAVGKVSMGSQNVSVIVASACPGAHALPPGDGLTPDAKLTDEASAMAWLNARIGTAPGSGIGPSSPLPDGSTVVRYEAKLVRQDETTAASPFSLVTSTPPGFSGWVVAVSLLDANGTPNWMVRQFDTAGDPLSMGSMGPSAVTAGETWPSWFDALPDHAS